MIRVVEVVKGSGWTFLKLAIFTMLDQHRLHSSTKSFHSLASKCSGLHQVVVNMSSQLV